MKSLQERYEERVHHQLTQVMIEGSLGATSTSTEDVGQPGLTLETLEQVIKEIEMKLPEVVYQTSKYVPVVDDDGEPLFIRIDRHVAGGIFGVPPAAARYLIVLNPDNLPLLQRAAKWNFRLVPLFEEGKLL